MFDRDDVTDVVGSQDYLKELETLEQQHFSQYTPDDVLELNRARYVAEAARTAGDQRYADRVEDIREEFFEPLDSFDLKAMKYDDPNDPELLYKKLTDREKTFLHYPGPPNHLLPAAEGAGMMAVPQNKLQEAEQDDFLKGQVRLKAVGEGAKQLARQSYQDMKQHWEQADDDDDVSDDIDFGFDYKSADEYANAVAFNITLAAEAMFENNGNDFNLDYGP